MSAEVEIIECTTEIIEISDDEDDIIIEEPRDLLIIDYSDEDNNEDNYTNICHIVKDDPSQVAKQKSNNVEPTLYFINPANTNNRKRSLSKIDKNSNSVNQQLNKVPKPSVPENDVNSLLNTALIETERNSPISNREGELNNSSVNEPTNYNSEILTPPENLRKRYRYALSKLKWIRPLKNLSSPPHLQIVIVDRSHPHCIITGDKWLMIEKRLLEALHSEMLRTNDTSIGLFDGAKWVRGIKVVGCHNENAFNFITKFILNLDKLWNGAQLDAFPIASVSRHILKAYIPPPTLKTDLILSLIKLQNPSICCDDWEVVRERERANNRGVDIWLSVNSESFKDICRLRGEIKFGINRIFLNPSQ